MYRDAQQRTLRIACLAGPIMDATVRNTDDLKQLCALDIEKVSFVGEALKILRNELPNGAGGTALLGFVGSPWTLATYIVEVDLILGTLESSKSFLGWHFQGLIKMFAFLLGKNIAPLSSYQEHDLRVPSST